MLAQKHDYIWVTGDSNTPTTTSHGGITIDFNQNPVNAYYNFRKLNMFICNASICDSSGQLVAYTNGCDIAGADDEILEGGAEINPGFAWQISCIENNDGYNSGIQSAVFLPMPDTGNLYYLFHKQTRLNITPFFVYPEALLYSIVEENSTSGKYEVTKKNVPIISDTLSYGELVTVKHANGKDWWVITPRRYSNTFYILKFNHEGIVDTIMQTVGIKPSKAGEGYGQIVFSPDGSKIYRTNPFSPIMVYNFDREAGLFTGFDTISFDYGAQSVIGEIGCAVSPSGQFLYLGCRKFLYQLDLWAPDISASQTVVAEWDGYAAPIPTMFYQLQLGPDCKIYGLGGGDTRFYHVIHRPDEPGLACAVEQRGLPLPTPSGASMPSFPNFRLGPLNEPGLPCLPVVGVGLQAPPVLLPELSVFPNPAGTWLKVITNRSLPGGCQWTLFDALGWPLRNESVEMDGQCLDISLDGLAAGVYYWALHTQSGEVVQQGKVMKRPD